VPESPQEFYDRVSAVAAASADGRLPVSADFTDSDVFPFEGAGLRVQTFEPPVVPEPPREGEVGGKPCHRCELGDAGAIWGDERWMLVPPGGELGIPFTALLMPRAHLDFADLDAQHAAELGPLMLAVERAVKSLGNIGRVHIALIGDGAVHLHLWIFARPLGQLQLRGSCLVDWLDLLPPTPAEQLLTDQKAVAAALVATYGGLDLTSR
jgi:hypothetical protein